MKIKCIIIDDEPLARKGMMEYIGQVDFLEITGVFENAQKAFAVLESQQVDLIFLDIEMPKLSGISFLKSVSDPPLVIFTTAYPDYALEGYELDVIDFLVKPIAFTRFLKAVNKVKDILSSRAGGYFFVKDSGRFVRVSYNEVLYIEALQNYVAIHCTGRKVVSYITLTVLETQLPSEMFMRVHKSYIVAFGKINAIQASTITIGTATIPVSRKIKDQLARRVLENRLLKR